MAKAVFCKLMTQVQRNRPGSGRLRAEMVVKLRSGEGGGVSWGLSLPCWSSRTQRDSLSQNQGKLEGLGPPHLNPDLILLPCGELSELQLPSEGPSQSHPPSVASAWAWYHLRAIKKKRPKDAAVKNLSKKNRMEKHKRMVMSLTQRYIQVQVDLTGLHTHPFPFTYFKSPKPLAAQWYSFGSALTDLYLICSLGWSK